MIDDAERLSCHTALTEAELHRQTLHGTRDWEAYPATIDEVKAWRAAVARRAASRRTVSLTAPGSIHFLQMMKAEKRFEEVGLL